MVDANVLLALEIDGPATEAVRKIAKADRDWRLPPLWRAEFGNALVNLTKAGKMWEPDAEGRLREAVRFFGGGEVEVEEVAVFRRAAALGLTFYDASYLALAEKLGVVLVTLDRELIAKGSGRAVDPRNLRHP